MEGNATKQAVRVNETVFDSAAEIPLQTDITLPDYCPDVVKILKCSLESSIRSVTAKGKKLKIKGTAVIQVLYLGQDDNKMRLSSASAKLPFTRELDMKGEAKEIFSFLSKKSTYCNCRAVNRRKLELQAAVTYRLCAFSTVEEKIITAALEQEEQPQGIQLRKKMYHPNSFVRQARQSFDVHEELELFQDKEPIKNILSSRICPVMTNRKVISGKIITRGTLHVNILYCADGKGEDKLSRMEWKVPISVVVDAPGAEENSSCCAGYDVCEYSLTPKGDQDGESFKVELNVQGVAWAQLCCQQSIVAADDCYSTRYCCEGKSRSVNFLSLENVVEEKSLCKNDIEMPEDIEDILDVWAVVEGCSTHFEEKDGEQKIVVHADIGISVLADDKDGGYQFYDRTEGFDYTLPAKLDGLEIRRIFCPQVRVAELDYSWNKSLQIRCELETMGCIGQLQSCKVLEDINLDTEKPVEREDGCALTLYYADPGENLWEIAKKYRTGMQPVLESNDQLELSQEEEICQRQMLIIPISAK